jgi:hypothetical protein
MKIAYICDKEHYLKKMSRVRFHSMEAIEKLSGKDNFLWTGPNWENFDNSKTVDENLANNNFTPDVIVGYKPLEIRNKWLCRLKIHKMYQIQRNVRR